LAFEGVEHETQHLERNATEQNTVIFLAENDGRGPFMVVEPKESFAYAAGNPRAIGQCESTPGTWLYSKLTQHGRWNYGVESPRVNEEAQPNATPGSLWVGDGGLDMRHTHGMTLSNQCRFSQPGQLK
jgi:hypothetical protein